MEEDLSEYDAESIFDNGASGSESTASSIKVAREDIRLMNVVRAIVILILLTFAFITANTVFVIASIAEENNFRVAYEEAASKLIVSFYEDISNKLWVAQTLATEFTLSVHVSAWPNVTIPDFGARCAGPMHLAEASFVLFSPFVVNTQRAGWENYATQVTNVSDRFELEPPMAASDQVVAETVSHFPTGRTVAEGIYRFQRTNAVTESDSANFVFPVWQTTPQLANATTGIIGTMFNQQSNAVREQAIDRMIVRQGSVMSTFLFQDTNESDLAFYSVAFSSLYSPIFDNSSVSGALSMEFNWAAVLSGSLSDFKEPLVVVLDNACGGNFSYNVTGMQATFMGPGDLHDTSIDGYMPTNSSYMAFAALFRIHGSVELSPETACNYKITVYPTQAFKGAYHTSMPDVYLGIILLVFFIMIAVFLLYDCLVEKRQNKVVTVAQRSDAIVRSLFPEAIRDRLYENAVKKEEQRVKQWKTETAPEVPNHKLKELLDQSPEINANNDVDTEPIADFFPNTTVLFADIAGFTAWSSEREPAQVFTLLETIYRAMDRAAKKFKVFKVETVGDCYVAATGIPEPQPDHAEIMARFARTCLLRVNELTKALEARLGPGTGELAMRFGIHSGPVTAGVLRGQKARFQLFGDTMNTASRMESTGMKNKVQLSYDTAKILIKGGHQHWVSPRPDTVHVKGKGECQTFWLLLGATSSSHASTNVSDDSDELQALLQGQARSSPTTSALWHGTDLERVLGQTEIDDKLARLVDWNTEVLLTLLKRLVALAKAKNRSSSQLNSEIEKGIGHKGTVLDEIKMIISLPKFDAEASDRATTVDVSLDAQVVQELKDYVTAIASGYPKNAFHNFEHASHVILSANKLMKRVVTPDEGGTAAALHDYTYGIRSDPLAQFAIVFSALIHDVGHKGVPNGRLSVEEPDIAAKYLHKSVAEQRSVDIAWKLLMLPSFDNLRRCIYTSKSECERFRALLVNAVMATDIFDKDLKALRNQRWDLAFHKDAQKCVETTEDFNLKATIVLEHIIQASDVAHTMQHWHIYKKWNERLFREMYLAYLSGRSDTDPSTSWFAGELWFFDNYVIPLAEKLNECGVFGVAGDEYLNYAQLNRSEWERKGEEIVAAVESKVRSEALKLGLIKRMDAVTEDGTESSLDGEEAKFAKKSTTREIVAPPGKLGIAMVTSGKVPVIKEVDPASPLFGKVATGDRLVEIDGVPTESMSIWAIADFFEVNGSHTRRILIERSADIDS